MYIRPKEKVHNPLWKRQLCPEFIDLIMENKKYHKSGSSSTLYNVSMKGLPLSPQICIGTSPVCFSVTKLSFETSMYLFIYTSEPVTESQIYGVMWQVSPDSKIQLVSWKMYPKYLLGLYIPEEICVIDASI